MSQTETEPDPLEGLTDPVGATLERFAIRMRESGVTHAAWRLSVSAAQGEGAIVLVEISPDRSLYRGDGIFLGWTQERLEAAYRLLRPNDGGPTSEFMQLG